MPLKMKAFCSFYFLWLLVIFGLQSFLLCKYFTVNAHAKRFGVSGKLADTQCFLLLYHRHGKLNRVMVMVMVKSFGTDASLISDLKSILSLSHQTEFNDVDKLTDTFFPLVSVVLFSKIMFAPCTDNTTGAIQKQSNLRANRLLSH